MNYINIDIAKEIDSIFACAYEDAQYVFELIFKAFKDKKKVIISFKNIDVLTISFLNTAVGKLYEEYSDEFIKENLKVVDISESYKVMLRRAIDKATLRRTIDAVKLYPKDTWSIFEISEDIDSEFMEIVNDNLIKECKENNTFQSKIRKEVFFDSKKDVQFFNALIELSPNSDTEKIINVMRVVFKLLDVNSNYSL